MSLILSIDLINFIEKHNLYHIVLNIWTPADKAVYSTLIWSCQFKQKKFQLVKYSTNLLVSSKKFVKTVDFYYSGPSIDSNPGAYSDQTLEHPQKLLEAC